MESPTAIILTGPESSGKTRLCRSLAHHFQTLWIEEYARTYLSLHPPPYTLNDLLLIAQEQYRKQTQTAQQIDGQSSFYFCDTSLLVIKIWAEEVFSTCPAWIDQHLSYLQSSFFLLLKPDIPWEADPLRENPHDRMRLFNIYEQVLIKRSFNYQIIEGSDFEKRKQKAIQMIQEEVMYT